MIRSTSLTRSTTETAIQLDFTLDGSGIAAIHTGIAFFDHMLTLWTQHGLFDLKLQAQGDLDVDFHHTVEDVGICLGQALRNALGSKEGIQRYGTAYLPMDETLVRCVIDLSGRPFLHYQAPSPVASIRDFAFQLVEEFMRGFAMHALATVHIEVLYGKDAHHLAEAIFKALGRALDTATQYDPRRKGIPSTKGVL